MAAAALQRQRVEPVSAATVHLLLQSQDRKLGREKMGCVAHGDEEYMRRREDVLGLYEKPLWEEAPVVGVAEKPVLLHQDTRAVLRARPATLARRN
jgi:hypothetical protein